MKQMALVGSAFVWVLLSSSLPQGALVAQNHDQGLLVTSTVRGVHLGRMTAGGGLSAVTTVRSGVALAHDIRAATMALDNRGYVLAWLWSAPRGNGGDVVLLDDAFQQTASAAWAPGLFGAALSPDGRLYVSSDSGVLRYFPSVGRFTTLSTQGIELALDVHSGQFFGNALRAPRLHRVGIVGSAAGAVTTVSTFPTFTHSFAQHHATGDFYGIEGTSFTTASLVRVTPAGVRTTLTTRSAMAGLLADRGSAASPRLLTVVDGALEAIDPITGASLGVLGTVPTGWSIRAFDRGRNLATELDTPGRWFVRASFPGRAGKRYAIGLSLTGTQPGVALADGRKIALQVDALTVAGLSDALAPAVQRMAGILDAEGGAAGVVDVRRLLGTTPTGIRLWAIALVLDPTAPTGIDVVSDPVVIVM